MNYSKSLDTLVEDIYKAIDGLSENKDISISEEIAEEFGNKIKEALLHWATPRNQEQGLRMSNIGKPSRQLWYDMKLKAEPKKVHPSVQIKFLYGHLLEEVLLMLTKLAGHTVEDEQKEVTVSGIKGHIDCKIDGEVVDIKSASKFAFKKFEEGTLGESDSFGYLAQLAGYEKALKTNKGGFLVINKETLALVLRILRIFRIWSLYCFVLDVGMVRTECLTGLFFTGLDFILSKGVSTSSDCSFTNSVEGQFFHPNFVISTIFRLFLRF